MILTRVEPSAFTWSSATGPAARVRRIASAATEADGRAPLNEAAELTLTHRGLEGGMLLLGEIEGADDDSADGGFAYLRGLAGPGSREVDLVVTPAARRRGLGGMLAAAALDAVPEGGLTAWSHGNHPAAARLAAVTGFEAVRELWLLRRPGTAPAPDRSTPAGCRIRPFRPGRDDAGFLAANAAAFASHPEQGALDQSGLDERKAAAWFDPAGFLVAERDGRLVGYHWTKVQPESTGEVYVIGVAPGEQGSGLGAALLSAGLEHLRSRGVAEVALYVEADNNPAIQLYERRGFTHAPADTDVMYARR